MKTFTFARNYNCYLFMKRNESLAYIYYVGLDRHGCTLQQLQGGNIIVFTFTRTKYMKNEVSALFRLIVLSYRHVLNETNGKILFSKRAAVLYLAHYSNLCSHSCFYSPSNKISISFQPVSACVLIVLLKGDWVVLFLTHLRWISYCPVWTWYVCLLFNPKVPPSVWS